MSVDISDVRGIASLARLRLDDEELERLTGELNRILEHVETLQGLDTSTLTDDDAGSIVTDNHAVPGADVASTRPSEADSPDPLAAGIDRAGPDVREGFFVVPPLPGLGDGA